MPAARPPAHTRACSACSSAAAWPFSLRQAAAGRRSCSAASNSNSNRFITTPPTTRTRIRGCGAPAPPRRPAAAAHPHCRPAPGCPSGGRRCRCIAASSASTPGSPSALCCRHSVRRTQLQPPARAGTRVRAAAPSAPALCRSRSCVSIHRAVAHLTCTCRARSHAPMELCCSRSDRSVAQQLLLGRSSPVSARAPTSSTPQAADEGQRHASISIMLPAHCN